MHHPESTHLSENYGHLVHVAQRVPGVFAVLIQTVAARMQLDVQPDSSASLQAALTRFLSDVQADLGPTAFRQLYPERMVPLVWLLSTVQQSDATIVVEEALRVVRMAGDVEQFVVLVTHFPHWTHLWDRSGDILKSV